MGPPREVSRAGMRSNWEKRGDVTSHKGSWKQQEANGKPAGSQWKTSRKPEKTHREAVKRSIGPTGNHDLCPV